jgi:hypothetical protein
VHVNRLKKLFNPGAWREKTQSQVRKARRRNPEPEEVEEFSPPLRLVSIPHPIVDDRQRTPETPRQRPQRALDTPATQTHSVDTPTMHRLDPEYVLAYTPQTRRELGTASSRPPVTRLQTRLQALWEAPSEEGEA